MKIKKLLVGALAAVTMASAVGVSNTPVFAAENEAVVASINYGSISCITPFPDESLKEETSFEHNGINYGFVEAEDKYYAYAIASPHEVRYLAVYSHLFDKEVDYSQLDFSTYTNVIKVIINANNPNMFYSYLTSLTKEFDLYLTGQFMFNEYVKELNIRGLYHVCPYYGNSEVLESIEHLNGSKIDAVYNYRFGNNYWAYNTSTFDDAGITNDEGTALKMQTITDTSELRFDLEDFNPYDGYKVNVPYLGASGWNEVDDMTNDGLIKDKIVHFIRTIDSKVETLYLDIDGFKSNNMMFDCKRLVLPYYDGQSFLNSSFDELVLINNYEDHNFTDFQHAKTIRFVSPESGGGYVWKSVGKNVNYIQEIEKILIPQEYAESHYQMLIDDTDLGPKVELYDESTYTMPTRSSFLSSNGNIYEVEDQSLLLADLEADIAVMTSAGVTPTTDTPVDLQIAAYYESLGNITEPDTGDNGDAGNTEDGNDEIVFEDESEFTTGLQTIGTLMYASDRDLEEIVKIASNFMVWNDGELSDPSEYTVKCNIIGGRLSITLYQGETIAKAVNINIDQVDGTYGEFIYVELFGTTRGVLLTDLDETRTTSINALYDYVMENAVNASEFNDVEIEDYSFAEANMQVVDSYYKHAVAGSYFQTSTTLMTQDYDLINNPEFTEVKTTGIINPDDDVEDAESEYEVKYIEVIYTPTTLNGKAFPYVLEGLVTKDGEVVTEDVTVSVATGPSITNKEDYSITLFVHLPDGCRYEHDITVKILSGKRSVGYVVFDDGSVVAITHCNSNPTAATLNTEINKFLTETLNIATPNFEIPEDQSFGTTKTYTGYTYGDGKELSIVNSGVGVLKFSTADKPVDDSPLKQGYNAASIIYFTDNYSINDVVKAIGNKILFKEGIQVDTEYRVESIIYDGTIQWTFYIGEDKVHSCQSSYHIVKDSTVGNFIYARAFEFKTGVLLLEKGNTNDFQDVYTQVIERCLYTITTPTTNTTLDLSKEGDVVVREVHELGDFNFYNVETTVYVVDMDSEVENTNTEIITPVNPNPDQGGNQGGNTGDSGNSGDSGNTGNQGGNTGGSGNTGNQGGNTGDSGNTGEQPGAGKDETPDDDKDTIDDIKDKVNNWFEDFKTKFEENKAVKAATIAFGCITGILLIYGIYVIFKKLFKWLGR